jgi:hypothetical protein
MPNQVSIWTISEKTVLELSGLMPGFGWLLEFVETAFPFSAPQLGKTEKEGPQDLNSGQYSSIP